MGRPHATIRGRASCWLRAAWITLLALSCGLGACAPISDEEAPGLHVLKEPEPESPEPPALPQGRKPGDVVTYRVVRGGTLLNVANLYKLHHNEIIKLNPEVESEKTLPPDFEVVVYRHQGEDSESIGLPHEGQLIGAMPMLEGPGRKITAERWKAWASRSSVLQLDRVLRQWQRQQPDAPPILVGNLSARQGGRLNPHKTHQSGRDVDLSYVVKGDGKGPLTWQYVTRDNLDAALTWELLKLLVKEAEIEVIFIDRALQRVLLQHAKKHGTVRENRLPYWLEVASGERQEAPLVRHASGHADHIHVRFACPREQSRCHSRSQDTL